MNYWPFAKPRQRAPKKPRDSCGSRLAEERRRIGQGRYLLAAVLGVDESTFVAWESCRAYPTLSQLLELGARFGVDCIYVLTGTRMSLSPKEMKRTFNTLLGENYGHEKASERLDRRKEKAR